MTLSTTGSIAELKPFTKQLIEEMKDNNQRLINQLVTRYNQTETELKYLFNLVFRMRSIPVGAGTLGSYVSGQGFPVRTYDGVVFTQEQFTW